MEFTAKTAETANSLAQYGR